jgi:cytochrome c peroxidase
MKKAAIITLISFVVLLFQFCADKDSAIPTIDGTSLSLPSSTFNYLVSYPNHIQNALTANDNTPANNRITNDGATLGRVLFYDTQLSANNTINCGSCHQQNKNFDDIIPLSKGFEGGLTDRKSMPLINVRFYRNGRMFWDERSRTLEAQVLQPIQNHVEMGLTLAQLENKVKALDYYSALFLKAFGNTTIDSVKISKALSQFIRSIVTYQSKYDRVKQGSETFSNAEAIGEQLFLNAGAPNTCASCHTPPMFITSDPARSFGLQDINDAGINNQNRFKSPSLRNISTRTNLFHNGSIANLQAMLNSGAPGSGTGPIPLHAVAPQDVQNMLAFLNTLTDQTILTEEKFSNPFK